MDFLSQQRMNDRGRISSSSLLRRSNYIKSISSSQRLLANGDLATFKNFHHQSQKINMTHLELARVEITFLHR